MNITTSIKKFIAKHKNFLFILLGVLIALALSKYVGYFREGLETIGEYEYLAPLPADNSITDATWNEYVKTMQQITKNPTYRIDDNDRKNYANNLLYVTEPEMKYFIVNKRWPIDNYVKTYIKTNRNNMIKKARKENPKITDTDIEILNKIYDFITGTTNDIIINGKSALMLTMMYSNRIAYKLLIDPEESKLSPQPLSYQIFMGTAKPPAPQQGLSKLTSPFKTVMVDANGKPKPVKLH